MITSLTWLPPDRSYFPLKGGVYLPLTLFAWRAFLFFSQIVQTDTKSGGVFENDSHRLHTHTKKEVYFTALCRTHRHTYTRARTHARTHTHTHTHTHARTHTDTHAHTCTYTRTRTDTHCTRTHTHTHIHTRAHKHTHTHTRIFFFFKCR